MNKIVVIPIIVIITIIAIAAISFEESDVMEVEDVMDKELRPTEEVSPEIQDKLEDIERTNLENKYTPKPREWITSGPFQIDRSEYVLGEKIFLVIGGLNNDEKGQIAFLRPLNSTHYSVYVTIPFDGTKKSAFNYYVEPGLSKANEICSIEDIVGEWTIVFRGTDYPNLKFSITDEILPGVEEEYKTVC
ncbi:hypothetical protein AAA799P11_00204 [Marine Group I thaumarchaeote SCGC AAA799-P11]|uniref:Uncharacterized protein n=1 Tax=Marine Group I thaumarchaeote SCGC AAA799-P11 TaxID=1502295 RepID=A0A087S329_9ARCH|nr:hypothetical protein AAA799P11_00204 [Marine Group I thaumarchaeote SCGC AAA799-P11]